MSVIPLQLSHRVKSPFLGSLTIIPLLQSAGVFRYPMSSNTATAISISAFSSSMVKESGPAAFPGFMPLMAVLISACVIFWSSMSSINLPSFWTEAVLQYFSKVGSFHLSHFRLSAAYHPCSLQSPLSWVYHCRFS